MAGFSGRGEESEDRGHVHFFVFWGFDEGHCYFIMMGWFSWMNITGRQCMGQAWQGREVVQRWFRHCIFEQGRRGRIKNKAKIGKAHRIFLEGLLVSHLFSLLCSHRLSPAAPAHHTPIQSPPWPPAGQRPAESPEEGNKEDVGSELHHFIDVFSINTWHFPFANCPFQGQL